MNIEIQCEQCGNIETVDDSETQTQQDPDGGTIEKGTCSQCGADSWQIKP